MRGNGRHNIVQPIAIDVVDAHLGAARPEAGRMKGPRCLDRSLRRLLPPAARANHIRTQRAQLKRDLKAGRLSIHTLLLNPPEYVETAKVFDMMLAVPKYGRVKVNKILTNCRISPSKTIGGLSERQRSELVSFLRR